MKYQLSTQVQNYKLSRIREVCSMLAYLMIALFTTSELLKLKSIVSSGNCVLIEQSVSTPLSSSLRGARKNKCSLI